MNIHDKQDAMTAANIYGTGAWRNVYQEPDPWGLQNTQAPQFGIAALSAVNAARARCAQR